MWLCTFVDSGGCCVGVVLLALGSMTCLYLIWLQGFSQSEISFAKAAFSNLIGGISYFYGQSK